MTPEQKQRMQKLEDRARTAISAALEHCEFRPLPSWGDVDFLLSLVKSQEAGGSNFSHLLPQTDYITKPQLDQKERYKFGHLFYEYTFNNCDHGEQAGRVCKGCVAECLAYLAQRCENAATSIRSARVGEVKTLWSTSRSADYNDAVNDAVRKLESLSIEKQKE